MKDKEGWVKQKPCSRRNANERDGGFEILRKLTWRKYIDVTARKVKDRLSRINGLIEKEAHYT